MRHHYQDFRTDPKCGGHFLKAVKNDQVPGELFGFFPSSFCIFDFWSFIKMYPIKEKNIYRYIVARRDVLRLGDRITDPE